MMKSDDQHATHVRNTISLFVHEIGAEERKAVWEARRLRLAQASKQREERRDSTITSLSPEVSTRL